MCASRASASTSSGSAYSRSIRSRTRRSCARLRRRCRFTGFSDAERSRPTPALSRAQSRPVHPGPSPALTLRAWQFRNGRTGQRPVMGKAQPFGIDFGGSVSKGAPVDLSTGEFAAERTRIETPKGGRPDAVADVVAELARSGAAEDAPVGITVPGVVVRGVVKSAANIDKSWIDTDAVALFRSKLDTDIVVVNDADAAGLAEARYGAAKDRPGLVVVTTLGTGIGTALVYDGVLVPNAELGHVEIGGKDAET